MDTGNRILWLRNVDANETLWILELHTCQKYDWQGIVICHNTSSRRVSGILRVQLVWSSIKSSLR